MTYADGKRCTLIKGSGNDRCLKEAVVVRRVGRGFVARCQEHAHLVAHDHGWTPVKKDLA